MEINHASHTYTHTQVWSFAHIITLYSYFHMVTIFLTLIFALANYMLCIPMQLTNYKQVAFPYSTSTVLKFSTCQLSQKLLLQHFCGVVGIQPFVSTKSFPPVLPLLQHALCSVFSFPRCGLLLLIKNMIHRCCICLFSPSRRLFFKG